MTSTPDATPCVSGGSGLLPVDPYRSLRSHFGMLLGVEDFTTVDAYHRGKMWLHNAWLHGAGAVWGLGVSLDLDHGEIRVAPGLAIDALGRELHLEADACVNVGSWFDEHRDEIELVVSEEDSDGAGGDESGGDESGGAEPGDSDNGEVDVLFDAHVVIQFKSCLTRQVPALSEPCERAGNTTAYSRVLETVELRLLPGRAPRAVPPPPSPYHRLRVLFRLEGAIRDEENKIIDSDLEVIHRRQAILGSPVEKQPGLYMLAFREFAALDEIDLKPAVTDGQRSMFPGIDPAPVVLADCRNLSLRGSPGNWRLRGGRVLNTIRRTLVPTASIQELLCGPLIAAKTDDEPPIDTDPPVEDAGGPRIDRSSVTTSLSDANNVDITFRIEGIPVESSIASAISVSLFDTDQGWLTVQIGGFSFDSVSGTVTLNTAEGSGDLGGLLRLIVRGTGPHPLLGQDGIPLAGETGGQPGTEHDGNDFVHMTTVDD